MAVVYKLVGFDRRTERIATAHEIPADGLNVPNG